MGFIFEARGIKNGGKMAAKMDQNGIQRLENGFQEGFRKRCDKKCKYRAATNSLVVPFKNIPGWGRDIPVYDLKKTSKGFHLADHTPT